MYPCYEDNTVVGHKEELSFFPKIEKNPTLWPTTVFKGDLNFPDSINLFELNFDT